jgi:nucleotide-binding universal stress UspA family protein
MAMMTIRSLLHPTDFSDHSAAALELAAAVARDYGARLTILHVKSVPAVPAGVMTPEPVETPEEAAETRRRLDAVHPADPKVAVEHVMLVGDESTEIVQLAKDEAFDLIVMGTHGRTGVRHMLMGSVAERVMRQAPCPVLTVKQPVPGMAYEPEPTAVARVNVSARLTAGGAK